MPSPAHGRRAALGLAAVCAGGLCAPLDTAVNVAFPAITAAFDLSPREIQWVVIPFVVAQSLFSLLFGRLGDLHGHRRVFATGLVMCVLTHTAIGFVPSYGWMILMRVLQGIAVGLAVSCAPAIATSLYPEHDKRRVLSIYVTSYAAGFAAGPLAGGVLVDWLGWPGVFWLRAPLALVVLLALPWVLGGATPPVSGGHAPAAPPGQTPAASGHAPVAPGHAPAAPVQPARAPSGLTRALRQPPFVALQSASIVINLACFVILLRVPYALAAWPGLGTSAAGVLLAAYPLGSLAGSFATGRLRVPVSSGVLSVAGMAIAGAGLLCTAASLPAQAPWLLACALAFTGAGLGAFQVAQMDATTSMLPAADRGVAGSLVNVTRLLGILAGAWGIGALNAALGSVEATIMAMGAGLSFAALVGAVAVRSAR